MSITPHTCARAFAERRQSGLLAGHHDKLEIANAPTERARLVELVDHEAGARLVRTFDLDVDFVRQKNAKTAQGAMRVGVDSINQTTVNPALGEHGAQIIDDLFFESDVAVFKSLIFLFRLLVM